MIEGKGQGQGQREVHNKLDIICRKYEKNKNTARDERWGCPRSMRANKEDCKSKGQRQHQHLKGKGKPPQEIDQEPCRNWAETDQRRNPQLETLNWLTKRGCIFLLAGMRVKVQRIVSSRLVLMLCPVFGTKPESFWAQICWNFDVKVQEIRFLFFSFFL